MTKTLGALINVPFDVLGKVLRRLPAKVSDSLLGMLDFSAKESDDYYDSKTLTCNFQLDPCWACASVVDGAADRISTMRVLSAHPLAMGGCVGHFLGNL